jgi:hypothetical protein
MPAGVRFTRSDSAADTMILATTTGEDVVRMSGRADAVKLNVNGTTCTLHAAPNGGQLNGHPAMVGPDGRLFTTLSVNLNAGNDAFLTAAVVRSDFVTPELTAGLSPVTLLHNVAVVGGPGEGIDLIYLAGITKGSTGATGEGGPDFMATGSSKDPDDKHIVLGDEGGLVDGADPAPYARDIIRLASRDNTSGVYDSTDDVKIIK